MGVQDFEPSRLHKHPYSRDDIELAKRFAHGLQVELKDFIREVVFFGSAARGPSSEIYERDIDVLVIVNDATASLSNEIVGAYRIITEKTAAKVSSRFHINTLRISAFWEYVLNGDPIAVNMIRDGIPLLNAGFLEPFKTLLTQGSIKPSKENVMVYMVRAPQTLMASRWHVLQGSIDLYWACLDACHAALIHAGRVPYSPKETMNLIESLFVKKKQLSKDHLETLKELHALSEGILSRSVKDVTGTQFAKHLEKTKSLVAAMKGLMRGQAA